VTASWPAWATERVDVVPADPRWAAVARGLLRDLHDRLRPWLDGRIEHVGSTAVPGLAAKPIVHTDEAGSVHDGPGYRVAADAEVLLDVIQQLQRFVDPVRYPQASPQTEPDPAAIGIIGRKLN
jgi:hypothetical protein